MFNFMRFETVKAEIVDDSTTEELSLIYMNHNCKLSVGVTFLYSLLVERRC